jgi:hypothetical protein
MIFGRTGDFSVAECVASDASSLSDVEPPALPRENVGLIGRHAECAALDQPIAV